MTEEGDFPTTGSTTTDVESESLSLRLTKLWIRIDGALDRLTTAMKTLTDTPKSTEAESDQQLNSRMVADRGSSANNIPITINLGGSTLIVVVLLTTIIGACGVVMGLNLSRQKDMEDHYDDLRRQYRMTELKLDDWTVVAHRSGLVLPGDYTRGPQGNLDSESFGKPKEK